MPLLVAAAVVVAALCGWWARHATEHAPHRNADVVDLAAIRARRDTFPRCVPGPGRPYDQDIDGHDEPA